MLLPFAADLELRRIPFVTILIALLCLGIYVAQAGSEERYARALAEACTRTSDVTLRMALQKWGEGDSEQAACMKLLQRLQTSADPQQELTAVMGEMRQRYHSRISGEAEYVQSGIEALYRGFHLRAGPVLTKQLWYEPGSWNPWHMLTAAVAHGSWAHVIGNLFFFWIFAGAVEVLLGWWRFGLFCIAMALGTHLTYSLVNLKLHALPTVGLSGVVYSVMALFACLLPQIRIKVFFWFLVGWRVLRVPSWLFVAWYVGSDAYDLLADAGGGVNFVAHVSGAFLAIASALLFFRAQMREGRDVDPG